MKTNKPTMSHNVCDPKSHRWLVNIFDVVEIDTSLSGDGVYYGYVSALTIEGIKVVRIKDGRSFLFTADDANSFLAKTCRCSSVVCVPNVFRSDVCVFSVGQMVVDRTFEDCLEWFISKFDLTTFRAFVYRVISGRTIGHWADIADLVDATRFRE